MSKELAGKVGLVTGASRGIGRAIAVRLASEGAAVAVNYAHNRDKALETVALIEAMGGCAAALQADLSAVRDVRRLFQDTLAHFGHLDILVNNAGTATFGPIADVTEDEFETLFALNVRGVFFALQEAAKHLADGGRIITLSSGITILGSAGGSLYAGSKGAVEQFTQAVAKEMGGRGITVNTVSAGMTKTDLLDAVVPEDVQNSLAASSVFGRLGQPNDIASVVALLARADAQWITGQNIRATGGAA